MKKYFILLTVCLVCAFALGTVAANAAVIYGTKHPPGSTQAEIYEIDLSTDPCTITLKATAVGAGTANYSYNGNAYDVINDRYYFSAFDISPRTLWKIDNFSTSATTSFAGDLTEGISNGTFYHGKYYYIGHLTDNLYEVTFDADGKVVTQSKIIDITNNTKGFYFGDIAYSPEGILYGSAAKGGSGGTRTFFIYNGATYEEFTDTNAPEALQIAFGDDGVLYGYAVSNNTFYTIDTTNGSVTYKCTSEIDFGDLASNIPVKRYSLCAGQTMDVGYVQVWDDGEYLTVTYNVDNPWCLTETHLHVAGELYSIPQKNGNPTPGHFDYGDDELGCVSSWSQKIPLEELEGSLHIAAHAVVMDLSGDSATGEEICADFSEIEEGKTVEGLGVVAEHLAIDAGIGIATKIVEYDGSHVAYGAPNSACESTPILNGGLAIDGGFSDLAAKSASVAHSYIFRFDTPITEFSLRMLDFGDYNPKKSSKHSAVMEPSYLGVPGTSQALEYESDGLGNPRDSDYGDLTCGTGDAKDAYPNEPGNYTWQVSGEGIDKVELIFGVGYDPNIGFDTLCFTTAGTETAWGNGPCDESSMPFEGKNWATYFIYTVE